MVANPARGQLSRILFSSPRLRLRTWSHVIDSIVPSSVSVLIFHTQAGSDAYSRGSSCFPRRRPWIPSTATGSVPSLHQVTQMRTNGVHCQESPSTEPAVLEIIPVTTGAAFSGFTMGQSLCASLFPRPHLAQWMCVRYRKYRGNRSLRYGSSCHIVKGMSYGKQRHAVCNSVLCRIHTMRCLATLYLPNV